MGRSDDTRPLRLRPVLGGDGDSSARKRMLVVACLAMRGARGMPAMEVFLDFLTMDEASSVIDELRERGHAEFEVFSMDPNEPLDDVD